MLGETFAEAALFATHYQCDAVALDRSTRARLIPKAGVLDRLGDDPAGIGGLLAAMAQQLHALRRRLELRNVRSARERILLALDLHSSNTAGVVKLDGSYQDFAAELGLTREALYRTLAILEGSGQVVRDGNKITMQRSLNV